MKTNRNLRAFSLAEAMITLLIVCLITLASIPVITKKKRTPDTTAHGAYYCTQVPDVENGGYKYVEFYTANPKGDIDDPTTWATVGAGATNCKFIPPVNARNFAVTLIGGGGAGSKGDSSLEEVLGDGKPTYTPTEEREYQLAMIGGGGGGASCYVNPNGDRAGRGGSGGGAGGFIIGKVKLKKDIKYGFTKGLGGAASNNHLDDDPSRAGRGTDTIFKYEKNNGASGTSWVDILYAFGAQGGEQLTCDHDCGDKDCYGGNNSSGGGSSWISVVPPYNDTSVLLDATTWGLTYGTGAGGTGYGHNNVYGAYTTAGKGTTFNSVEYGGGGRGCYRGTCQEPGKNGHFSLSLINLFGGEGGSAAVPETVAIPKIPGYLKISVGLGGTSDETRFNPGETTTVQVYNKAGIPLRKYHGNGAAAGRFQVQAVATPGQNSLWTDKGGGAVGVCYPPSEAWTEKKAYTAVTQTGKCKRVIGVGGSKGLTNLAFADHWWKNPHFPYYWEDAMWAVDAYTLNDKCPMREYELCTRYGWSCGSIGLSQILANRKEVALGKKAIWAPSLLESQFDPARPARCLSVYYCSQRKALEELHKQGYYLTTGVDETNGLVSDEEYAKFLDENLPYDKKFMCIFKPDTTEDTEFNNEYEKFTNSHDYDAFWKFLHDEKIASGNPKYLTYWTPTNGSADNNFQYECAEFEMEEKQLTETIYHPAGEVPAHCDKASNGTGFGAGGGGGQYTEQIGVNGLGGDGAPGAVIIEW